MVTWRVARNSCYWPAPTRYRHSNVVCLPLCSSTILDTHIFRHSLCTCVSTIYMYVIAQYFNLYLSVDYHLSLNFTICEYYLIYVENVIGWVGGICSPPFVYAPPQEKIRCSGFTPPSFMLIWTKVYLDYLVFTFMFIFFIVFFHFVLNSET